jgi:hypothetical protein
MWWVTTYVQHVAPELARSLQQLHGQQQKHVASWLGSNALIVGYLIMRRCVVACGNCIELFLIVV